MGLLLQRIRQSPTLVRVVPFAIFLALTSGQGLFSEEGRYWIYLAKTVLGAWMLWMLRSNIAEMRWKLSGEAIAVGVAVFVLWVGLDRALAWMELSYPKLRLSAMSWNPGMQFGEGSTLAWCFIAVRIAGSSLVVPPLEEVFYRSFLYRYLAKADFLSVPMTRWFPVPFFVTAVVFGLSHREWLAAILCACAYQGLVLWKNRLGDAITAHAITNLLLGVWVVWKGAWHYW
jgi:uncharacterized protein